VEETKQEHINLLNLHRIMRQPIKVFNITSLTVRYKRADVN